MNATPVADAQGVEEAEVRTGGCLCGRIRFTTRGPAVFPHTGACERCQKLGGTPVMWWVWLRDGHLDRRERTDLVRDLQRRGEARLLPDLRQPRRGDRQRHPGDRHQRHRP
ncbi:GFA family protein [Streptomyces iakyrus]